MEVLLIWSPDVRVGVVGDQQKFLSFEWSLTTFFKGRFAHFHLVVHIQPLLPGQSQLLLVLTLQLQDASTPEFTSYERFVVVTQ
jgi:hypothetical protein